MPGSRKAVCRPGYKVKGARRFVSLSSFLRAVRKHLGCTHKRLSPLSGVDQTCPWWVETSAFDPERTSRCFGLGADIKNFAPELRSNNSSGLRAAPCVGGLRRRINALPR